MGSAITPIAMTDAATMPVVARKDRTDENHRIGKSAAHRAEQLADGVEQILREPASLQDRPHQGEERDGEQESF